ncbi:unnamed protein product, partial [Hapterophycus canaliculatus]
PCSVEILRGSGASDEGGYIEVRPGGVNKGAFVSAILSRQVEMGLTPDFILAMGDEESDEMMYEAVKDFSRGVKGEEPGTPDTIAPSAKGGTTAPRRDSYQVGATAAVLIASAAAELKRQQEEALEKEAAEVSGLMGSQQQSQSAGRLASPKGSSTGGGTSASAPPDVNAAAIAVMAGLEEAEKLAEEKTPGGMTMMNHHETFYPLTGGDADEDDGIHGDPRRGRAASLAETGSGGERAAPLKPTSLTIKPRFSPGSRRWRGGILGAPGGVMGSSPGGGSIIGAGTLGVQCFTCTVGKKPSQAGTYVNDIDEV